MFAVTIGCKVHTRKYGTCTHTHEYSAHHSTRVPRTARVVALRSCCIALVAHTLRTQRLGKKASQNAREREKARKRESEKARKRERKGDKERERERSANATM